MTSLAVAIIIVIAIIVWRRKKLGALDMIPLFLKRHGSTTSSTDSVDKGRTKEIGMDDLADTLRHDDISLKSLDNSGKHQADWDRLLIV